MRFGTTLHRAWLHPTGAMAGAHAAGDILNLEAFDEDDLYENLDWLCAHRSAIEDRLAQRRKSETRPTRKGHTTCNKRQVFLYDVTSNYLEERHNELEAFGYNRDGKKGKRQIVTGLLCDEAGLPLSIEAFKGNAADPTTFASQVHKAVTRFGDAEVTFVGDRGMIKSQQIEDLTEHGFHYITAITKPQIESLLSQGVFLAGVVRPGTGRGDD